MHTTLQTEVHVTWITFYLLFFSNLLETKGESINAYVNNIILEGETIFSQKDDTKYAI